MSARSRNAATVAILSIALTALGSETMAPASATGASSAATAHPARASAPASGPGRALALRSAFEGYRGFSEQPVGSWRQANDLVGRIGGWQAYAREGQGGGSNPAPETGKVTPATKPGPPSVAGAAASSAPSGAHSAHRTP